MRRIAILAAAWIGCLILGLRAQSGPSQQPPPIFRADVDVIQLDVSVLDKNRRPVKGLAASDFTILEDGRAQPIVAFAAVDIPDPIEPPAAWMRDVPSDVSTNNLAVRRVIVIVLDDAHMPFDPNVSTFAKQIARSVVDRLGPNDLAAVAFTDTGRRQNVTNDRQRLRAAIDSLVPH